jgi:hypothetical protein
VKKQYLSAWLLIIGDLSMRPSRNSGITMPTIGTMVNLHPPSPFTGKDTRESNHGNAPSSIQTAK